MNDKKVQIKDSIFITGIHSMYWPAMTIFSTFLVTYLKLAGYDTAEIGLIVSVAALTNAIVQPIWGYIADRKRNLKLVLLICFAMTIPIALMFPKFILFYEMILILNLLFAAFERPIAGLLDSLTNISSENNKYVIYGISRGFGSFFSAIFVLIAGNYLADKGIDSMVIIYSGLMFIGLLFTFLFSGDQRKENTSGLEHKTNFISIFKELVSNKPYMFVLISSVLLNIGLKAALTYTPVMLVELGGDTSHTGLSMAVNTIGMLPAMIAYSYMFKKGFSNISLYYLACVFTIIRIFSLAFVSTINSIISVQIINSLSYGFLQPAMIFAIGSVTFLNIRASAITLTSSLILAVSSLFGDYFAGILIEFIGISNMFILFGFIAIIGMVLFIPYQKYLKEV